MRHAQIVLDAASIATRGICETILMLPCEILSPPDAECAPKETPSQISIPLVNDQVALEVGLVADWDVCTGLARTLLQMAPEDPIEDQDVTDGIAELVNILGGMVKTELNGMYPSLKLGLPLICVLDARHHQQSSVKVLQQWVVVGQYHLRLTAMMQEHSDNGNKVS